MFATDDHPSGAGVDDRSVRRSASVETGPIMVWVRDVMQCDGHVGAAVVQDRGNQTEKLRRAELATSGEQLVGEVGVHDAHVTKAQTGTDH